jgi:hypothetical protein
VTVHIQELSEQTLLVASNHHRTIIDGDDVEAIAALLHQNFIINGPNNRCGARDQIVRLSQGAFAHGKCHRHIERVAITGNVGVLMGDEIVTPDKRSLLADWFGTNPLRRRFTDMYVFEDGKWLLLACQASVVREANEFRR